MVSRSGSASARLVLVTAIARTLPALICCTTVAGSPNIMLISPDSNAIAAGPPPLYGTCTILYSSSS